MTSGSQIPELILTESNLCRSPEWSPPVGQVCGGQYCEVGIGHIRESKLERSVQRRPNGTQQLWRVSRGRVLRLDRPNIHMRTRQTWIPALIDGE